MENRYCICYIINRNQNSPLLTSRILSFTNANSVSVNVASSDALSDDGVSLNPPVGLYVIGYWLWLLWLFIWFLWLLLCCWWDGVYGRLYKPRWIGLSSASELLIEYVGYKRFLPAINRKIYKLFDWNTYILLNKL